MSWFIEVIIEFFAALARGDRSWWPFILSVLAMTLVAILVLWLAAPV